MAASIVKILRVVADPNRLRILLLLKAEELSVAELQEILVMGQSTISTHLSQLKQAGLVEDRRIGKSSLYRLVAPPIQGKAPNASGGHQPSALKEYAPDVLKRHDFSRAVSGLFEIRASASEGSSTSPNSSFLDELLAQAATEIPEAVHDRATARRVVKKRQDKMRAFFDGVAGRLGKDYVPGKSWKAMAEALLRLMPPMVIADLGAGDGSFSLLLAQNAEKVIAIDSSAKMIEFAREQAHRHHVKNVDYRLGDMEELPIDDTFVDLVFFSQSLHHALHPDRAVAEAVRILKPGGRIAILDLAKHRFEEAREMYADEWLGFSEAELESMLHHAGFQKPQTSVVYKEDKAPYFQTLLAVASKAD
jgi:ubiquinone/menaquinone biosynthesis C-methylase UbiE/DNA-binding transcriptional ArsR family regulator